MPILDAIFGTFMKTNGSGAAKGQPAGGTQPKKPTGPRNTVQKSIPYERVYADSNGTGGIIETKTGTFTKSYYVDDTSYSDCGDEEQENILDIFERFLNTFNAAYNYQITINNKNVDRKKFNDEILMKFREDDVVTKDANGVEHRLTFDNLREENNDIYLAAMQDGKNNLRSEIYFTIALDAIDIKDAQSKFNAMETELNITMKRLNGSGLKAMSVEQRLEALHDIYNLGNEGFMSREASIDGIGGIKSFSLEAIRHAGMTTKDAIGPNSFDFTPRDYMMIGNKYARVLFLKTIPSRLTSVLLENFASLSTNLVISTYYKPVPQEKAQAFASGQVTNIGGDVIKAQKSLAKSGVVSPELISPKLQTAQRDAAQMLDDIVNHSKKLFHVTVLILIFADNKEDLKLFTEQVKTKAREVICSLDVLTMQQEAGLNAVLPLCNLGKLSVHKIMTSETASALQPFSTKDICHPGGIYYGVNTQSKNIIMYNRMSAQNQNGVILGVPGGGKSFIAKSEMEQVFLNQPKSQIFVVDPEREYVVIAKRFGGQVIKISPGASNHINPLDLDMTKEDGNEGSPLAEKIDYITSLCEIMLGHNTVLTGYARSIIDQTLQKLYDPYLTHLKQTGKTIDTDACPTLADFYVALKKSPEDEARQLAANLQMYCVGSQDLFAHKTTVNADTRFVVYDISDIGSNLQELGMQICLSDIWNRMVRNKSKGIRTWFYLDEFYLMLRMAGAAQYLQMVWKRARKWMGVPTGLTQNVTDLLGNDYGYAILATSEFAIMLNQAPADRPVLAELYQISPEQQEYFTNSATGHGLLRCGSVKVPFSNTFPTDTELYSIMSTKPTDSDALAKLGISV